MCGLRDSRQTTVQTKVHIWWTNNVLNMEKCLVIINQPYFQYSHLSAGDIIYWREDNYFSFYSTEDKLTSQTNDTSLYIKDQLISTAIVVTMLRLKFWFVPSDSPPLAASTSWARCCYYCCAYTTNEKGYIKTRHDVRTKPGDLVGNLLQSNTTSYSNTEDFDCYLL